MASGATFTVEILTPEGEVFSGDVLQLSTRTVLGEIGVLANHVPILAALKPNLLRLRVSDSETREFAQSHGTMQVFANHVRLLLEEAIPPSELDVAAIEAVRAQAESKLDDPDLGERGREFAERDLERTSTFLEIAQGE